MRIILPSSSRHTTPLSERDRGCRRRPPRAPDRGLWAGGPDDAGGKHQPPGRPLLHQDVHHLLKVLLPPHTGAVIQEPGLELEAWHPLPDHGDNCELRLVIGIIILTRTITNEALSFPIKTLKPPKTCRATYLNAPGPHTCSGPHIICGLPLSVTVVKFCV